MNKIFYSIVVFIYSFTGIYNHIYSQNCISGIYTCVNNEKTIFLKLQSDSTFLYCADYSTQDSIGNNFEYGDWVINDSLLSLKFKGKKMFKVLEEYNKKSKFSIITVIPSNFPNEVNSKYNLYILTTKNDTLLFQNQNLQTKVNAKIKSFWIEDVDSNTKFCSYNVKSKKTNYFDVSFFKGKYVEYQNWKILNNKILKKLEIRKGMKDYYLIRVRP